MDIELDNEVRVVLAFAIFGIIAGLISGIAGLTGYQGLVVALVFFYISYRSSPSIMMTPSEDSKDMSTGDIFKTGIIPYWFLLLVFWTLTYTLSL